MTEALVVIVVFCASFVQTLSGFGFALMVMPFVTLALGLRTAAPLVALAGLTLYTINLLRHRAAFNLKEVLPLGFAAALGVPVGVWVLANADENLVRQLLGLILVAYASYALVRPHAPRLRSQGWAYPTGFAAGCLGGAYNTPGPPAIVYGSLRRWPKDEFRAAMQALFFLTGLLVVASHVVARHVTADVLHLCLYAAPALGLGVLAGSRADRWVDGNRFRTLVNGMVLVLGVALVAGLGRG
jgi:uncharacterized membrane protein YfcA